MNTAEAWKTSTDGLAGCDVWWAKISDAYNNPSRHYHNLAFLDRKFQLLEDLGTASDLKAVVLALFFQYFEYDPQDRASNKNLAHFQEFAKESDLPAEIISKVEALLSGDDDVSRDENIESDFQLLQDLDMSFLGLNTDDYAELILQERKEYDFMSDDAYKAMRRKILQTFLLIPSIFSTATCQSRFEAQARANIEAEVQSLGK